MQLQLTPEQSRYVREQVDRGLFRNEADVLLHALEQMRMDDEFTPEQTAYYRQEVAKGLASIKAGRAREVDIEQLIREERLKKGA